MSAPWTASVIRTVLPNGLTLLVQRDTSVPVVAVVTHVRAGYFDEPDEWVGIAHVLEHMYFKGTPERGPGVLARETQLLGGYLNAGTIYDKTVYYAVVPSAAGGLDRAVTLQADALMHAALDPEELSRELEVIIQEAKRKLDNPGAVTGETLYELLFRRHRMRRWRIGTEPGLRKLTAADLRAYYETRYTPDRVIVALTGDLDPDAAVALGERVYGAWARPPAAIDPGPTEPHAPQPSLRVMRGDVERPLAAVGWRTVEARHADTPALEVAAAVLGAGRASWLHSALRVPGLASAAHASQYGAGDVGVFDISVTSSTAHVQDAVRRAVGLADGLAREGPDPAQLARVRALLATYWARRLESVDGRATLLAEYEALGGYELADTDRMALEAVTAHDVKRVAAEWLRPAAASASVFLPEDAGGLFDDGAWPPSVEPLVPAPLPPPMAARQVRAPRPDVSEIGDVRVVRWPGADLVIRRRAGTGLVSLGAHLVDLPVQESEADGGISRLLVRAALRGAGGQSAEALATAAEALGGAIGVQVDADSAGLGLTVRADAAAAGAGLLRLVLADPTLAAADVEREAGLQADDAARRRDDMFAYPLEAVRRVAFEGDAYGVPALGEPDVVRAMTAAGLQAWHERALRSRVVVVAAGDLSLDELQEAGAAFADWEGAPPPPPPSAPTWCSGERHAPRAKAQSALAMAFPAPPAASDDRYPHAVLSALLSGLAGRLFDELRERRALAYTVYAAPWLRRRGGAVLTYIATSPDREDEARAAMLDVLRRVATDPMPAEELERARGYAAGLVPIGRQHVQAVADELARAWRQGWIERFAAEEAARRAVEADDLRRVARDVFGEGQRAEFVVRGTPGSAASTSDRPSG